MSLPKEINDLVEKIGRTEEDFFKLIDYLKENGGRIGKRYAKNVIKEQKKKYKKMLTFDVEVKKNRLLTSKGEMQMEGGGKVRAENKVIKEIPYNVECYIYRDLYTGLWKGEFTYLKSFLLDNKIYSFDKIAQLFGLEVKEKTEDFVRNPIHYLIFIKEYSPFEYMTINDLFFEKELNKNDLKILKSKKMQTLPQVKKDIEISANKITDMSSVIDDVLKQMKKTSNNY